ncbi:hypothetical protein SAMN04488067_105153 [Halorubrum xinjiangense]|uniref:Uncharacterized protein n=1 Tax=Halorubrum xinjiangense TaxID=261291 RepID=A0A1G7LY78_9EURY|nr:hypothetical protein [Halorubrum xinjiangense]SDF54518.1 hypothetical protein SAMN04488067_105153 [Halorubrum xinjiangense]
MPSRRSVLRAIGVVATGASAGCSRLRSRDARVDVTVFNQTDVSYAVEVVFYEDGASEAAAREFSSSFDVGPDGTAADEGVVEARRYLVRYRAYEENSKLTDEGHVHFIPSGDGTEAITFDIQETGELTRR